MARSRRWSPRWWTDFTIEHPEAAQTLHELRGFLPPLNFITLHYAYFIVVVLVTSLIFWGSSSPAYSISYTDSLFLTVSAMTEAGLNTVNLSQMTTWQQVLLFLLILFGGAIWVSIWTVAFRLHVFESRFEDIVKAEKARRTGSSLSLSISFFKTATTGKNTTTTPNQLILAGMGSKVETNGSDPEADDGPTVVRDRRSTCSLPAPAPEATEGEQSSDASHNPTPSPPAR